MHRQTGDHCHYLFRALLEHCQNGYRDGAFGAHGDKGVFSHENEVAGGGGVKSNVEAFILG